MEKSLRARPLARTQTWVKGAKWLFFDPLCTYCMFTSGAEVAHFCTSCMDLEQELHGSLVA